MSDHPGDKHLLVASWQAEWLRKYYGWETNPPWLNVSPPLPKEGRPMIPSCPDCGQPLPPNGPQHDHDDPDLQTPPYGQDDPDNDTQDAPTDDPAT